MRRIPVWIRIAMLLAAIVVGVVICDVIRGPDPAHAQTPTEPVIRVSPPYPRLKNDTLQNALSIQAGQINRAQSFIYEGLRSAKDTASLALYRTNGMFFQHGESWLANANTGSPGHDSVLVTLSKGYADLTYAITVTPMRTYRDSTEEWLGPSGAREPLAVQVISATQFYILVKYDCKGWVKWLTAGSL